MSDALANEFKVALQFTGSAAGYEWVSADEELASWVRRYAQEIEHGLRYFRPRCFCLGDGFLMEPRSYGWFCLECGAGLDMSLHPTKPPETVTQVALNPAAAWPFPPTPEQLKEYVDVAEHEGYTPVRVLPTKEVAGCHEMLFTCGLVVGITKAYWRTRYCYESRDKAEAALAEWDGQGDPPGEWIKQKPEDRLNPNIK